jgi:selenocysteine-specific elongation factor
MIVGTAGHIDHGKTTLVKALTGVDADRLPEEKARGITLDLGYAYAPLPDGSVLGFVDVPGHEKLIHNMLAGATGIDFVLLVIAADDGPMPQTREHLELLGLLGLTRGAVTLTKCDMVDAARMAAVKREIAELLAGSSLADAPVFPVAATNGSGVPELRSHLEAAAAQHHVRSATGRFRLAIDRCFSLAGAGIVVTGTAHAGQIGVATSGHFRPDGGTAVISPSGNKKEMRARVRSLHVQDRPAESGRAGDRIALAISGDFEKKDIARGMWLVDPVLAIPITRFHGELRVPRDGEPLRHLQVVHVHMGADDILGRVALLDCADDDSASAVGFWRDGLPAGEMKCPAAGKALVEILLERETLALRGDRFVLRDAGARNTVGGGRVLDIFPPARHKRSPERLALLTALSDDDPMVGLTRMAVAAPAGVDLARFAINWNLDDDAAGDLWHRAGLRTVGPLGFTGKTWAALRVRLLDALAREHERVPDMAGVERERLRRMTLATLPRPAFDALVDELIGSDEIARTRAWLHLPTHHASVSAADRDLFAALRPLLDAPPFNPPRVRDVFKASGKPEDVVRQLFKRLARAGELYPVAHDHYFTATAVAELATIVADLSTQRGAARAADLRDQVYGDGGGGRKVAIHILEFFDRIGYTRRVRDDHILRSLDNKPEWLPR